VAEPRVLVLRAAGTNCDPETAYAFESAGASASILHINLILERPALLHEFGLIALPGGFSYGDDVAAGKVMAVEIQHALGEHFRRFVTRGGLILGICNGFQVLVKTGLLGMPDAQGRNQITLSWNDSHRYEDRWVRLQIDPSLCVFAPRDRSHVSLPVAHGEGKLMVSDPALGEELVRSHQAVFRYVRWDGGPPAYPADPNGSVQHIAGLCDRSGQVLGLMPHPERALFTWSHPTWTREIRHPVGDGDCIFRAAVAAMR
jgi:phosphoribosylformylglycinamidine synthase I